MARDRRDAEPNLFGNFVSSKPANYIAPWRYLVLVFVVLIASIYAAPNLYPPDYALQIRASDSSLRVGETTLIRAQELLETDGISIKALEVTQFGGLIRLESSEDQLRGNAVLNTAFNPEGEVQRFVVAPNLAQTTPDWLRDLGGVPMALGLDLAGGLHFVLQVDIEQALAKRLDDEVTKIKDKLRDERIRYRASDNPVSGNALTMGFNSASFRDRAVDLIEEDFPQPDYLIESSVVDGRPGFQVTVQNSKIREIETTAIDQNLTSLRKRVNELGVAEPLVQKLGRSRIVIDLPGVQDSARAKSIIGKFANLEFRLVADTQDRPAEIDEFQYEGRTVRLQERVIVNGERVVNALQSRDPDTGLPQVSITLDSLGGELMHESTAPNIGRGMGTIFIEQKPVTRTRVVDGEEVEFRTTIEDRRVINVATIQAALPHNFRITGLDNVTEAQELALLLRAGSLAAPMYVVEERTVGASLGEENIERGITAVLAGFVLVLIFMVIYYKVFGLVADIALALNLVILVAVMSLLNATLTLPGIAGIVLTVGMAVDANVLIFARIREELRNSPPTVAIPAGYNRAFRTILDANLTTLFVALILLAIGSGPVAGFAVTLSIGIVTSMFTAIFGSRVLVNLIYERRKPDKVLI